MARRDARDPLLPARPAGLFLIVAIPLIAFAVLAWTFSSAVVRGLDIVVVDMDRSAVSADIVQAIAAAPGLRVAQRADNLTAATAGDPLRARHRRRLYPAANSSGI